MSTRRSFYQLSLWTLIAVYILILVGGIVRSTGSGMGCPDWPKCFGSWIPPTAASELPSDYKEIYSEYRAKKNVRFAKYLRLLGMNETADKLLADRSVLQEADFNVQKTWIEYVNRLVGVVIGFLIFAVFISSLKFRNTDRTLTVVAFLTFVLVGFQGWLGSFVVSTNLTPWTITVHMMLALVIVAMLIYLTNASAESRPVIVSPVSYWLLIACMVTLLIQIVLGTQVREAIDRVASIVVREQWIDQIYADLVIHRSFSWIIAILHVILIVKLVKTSGLKAFSIVLILLILDTILTGAAMSYFGVPAFLQPIHLLLATVTFGMQFMLLLKLKNSVNPILATQR